MKRPTETDSRPADFSLNATMRASSPIVPMQLKSQASSACSCTWLCTNTIARSGSSPEATSVANVSRVEAVSSAGSNGCVIECRSTTQKIDSAPYVS